MFQKVLIANRGEIVVRIARTCRRLGLHTIGVFSEADRDSPHTQACDEALCIGPAPVQESYLNAEKILEVARATGADAIHPGYGFLSESAAFAEVVVGAGFAFIGPRHEALRKLGNKVEARALARQAGVRVLPGSELLAAPEQATDEALRLGWPLMVKATAGGGGIGIQIAEDEQALAAALAQCAARAERAFADGSVYLERYLDRPRHVEVQVLRDSAGKATALGERECSVQRRHQKLIEESPAPALLALKQGDAVREAICDAAVAVMDAADYVGAGTCEFLIDRHGKHYFIEANARLQVEHGITEACTDVDLVEWQLLLASGETLTESLLTLIPSGHAMEARICAENPKKNFMPSPGMIEQVRWPPGPSGKLRIDTAIQPGMEVSPYYDSLIAKVITFGATRHEALLLLDRALAESVIEPLTTNIDFLRRVMNDQAFRAGQYDVSFVESLLAAD